MCYNSITGSAPSDLLMMMMMMLYSPSRSLRSSSDTRILKLRRFDAKLMAFALSAISVLISGTTSPTMSDTLILSLPSKTNSKTFLFSEHFNWVLLSFAPTVCIVFVCAHLCVCACVWCVCVRACLRACVGVCIYSCLRLYNVLQLCLYMNIFFFFFSFLSLFFFLSLSF